jgi:putrescine transport system permease protein
MSKSNHEWRECDVCIPYAAISANKRHIQKCHENFIVARGSGDSDIWSGTCRNGHQMSESNHEEAVMNFSRKFLIGVPYLWLLILFLVPFLIVLKISMSDYAISIPPYTPTLDVSMGWWAGLTDLWAGLDFENFVFLTEDDLYWKAYLSSIKIAIISTLCTLLVGFPIAYGMANAPDEWRPSLMMLVILPFWTSFLIRVYAWMGILSREGLLNLFLMWTGVISEPLVILNTNTAVYIGIVYTYLPFMILPIYSSLEKMDHSLLEAAQDLGCTRIGAFWSVTVHLAKPGIIAGSFLVFIPTLGEFVIPSLLGGSRTLMIGKVLWEEFFSNRDWTVASAVAIILLLILIIPIVLFQRNEQKQRETVK